MQALCFPASSLSSSYCKGQPSGAPCRSSEEGNGAPARVGHGDGKTATQVNAAPLMLLTFTPLEENQVLLRMNYPKRPSGIWPKV